MPAPDVTFLLLASLVANAPTPTCAPSFDTVVERQLAAIRDRDLPTFISTIGDYDGKLMVLPDGTIWDTTAAVADGHREWFADDTWTFETEIIKRLERESFGFIVFRTTVDRPERPGQPFLLTLLFEQGFEGCWTLLHDQNTPLPPDSP